MRYIALVDGNAGATVWWCLICPVAPRPAPRRMKLCALRSKRSDCGSKMRSMMARRRPVRAWLRRFGPILRLAQHWRRPSSARCHWFLTPAERSGGARQHSGLSVARLRSPGSAPAPYP